MKKIIIFLIVLLIGIAVNVINLAVDSKSYDNIYLNVLNSEIKIDEEFSFTINLTNVKVSAFDINIYFNNEVLEYVSGPDSTNVVDGRIITVWYDKSGGNNTKQNCELVKYTFKAKSIESEYIAIQGEFYDENGNKIQSFTDGIEVVVNKEKQTENIEISNESKSTSNSSKLQILRLNNEGITPIFSPDITEYYFLTEELSELEVTAVPENNNAQVNIKGNTNFKEGLNTIIIQVISQDKTSTTEYKIFVTKTNNLEKANANLENLAIENVNLEPEFINNIYQYNATVTNTTENLNILAVPEKQNANVEITGGQNLQFGNNTVNIKVIAENGYTVKQYKVNVYKRNEEEQKLKDEEQQNNIQKLNTILEEKEEEKETEENSEKEKIVENIKENLFVVITYIVICICILIIVVYRIKKDKLDKNKENKKKN